MATQDSLAASSGDRKDAHGGTVPKEYSNASRREKCLPPAESKVQYKVFRRFVNKGRCVGQKSWKVRMLVDTRFAFRWFYYIVRWEMMMELSTVVIASGQC
jgi:hypothetical protein